MSRTNAWRLGEVILLQGVAALFEAWGLHHWNLAAALLLLGFWHLPRLWWPVLALTGVLLSVVNPFEHNAHLPGWLAALVTSCVAMTGAAVLRLKQVRPESPVSVRAIAVLHLAALAAASSQALLDVLFAVAGKGAAAYGAMALLQMAVERFIGTFTGVMLFAPAWMAWLSRGRETAGRRTLRTTLRTLLLVSVLYLLCAHMARDSVEVSEILRVLLLIIVVSLALKEGWLGAVLGLLATAVLVTLQTHLARGTPATLDSHMFVAVVGALGLLLGASTDEHRARTREMRRADRSYEQLRMGLAVAAEGNLHRELRERNHIARELHDEFGQSLTAVQTQLTLLRDDFRVLGRENGLETLNVITRGMRSNIGSVLERLRPAVLDELGLYGATQNGSIRQLAEDAGLRYDVHLSGDARWLALLHDTHKLAAYRLVQESVTNVVRHAQATACSVHFRISTRDDHLYLFVDVRDDGIGMRSTRKRGNGLLTMQHRVTALDGQLRVRNLKPGLRIHAMFRQSLTA